MDKGSEHLGTAGLSGLGARWRRLPRAFRRALFLVAAGYLVAVIILAVAAPLVVPFSPDGANYGDLYSGPTATHLLGTDELGRDILSRLIYGGRVSLIGVAEALVVYLVIGLVFGVVAGYVGGVIDDIVVWTANVSFAVPQIIVILAVLAIFANNSGAAMLVLGLLGGPGLAVFARGATRTVRAEQYISAARVSGLNTRQIIWRHVLPMIVGPVVVQASLFAGIALIFQTGLDYLGIGTQPPTPSWGSMVAEASTYLARDPWMVVPAGLVITLTIISFGLIGDTCRDWYAERSESAPIGAESGRQLLVRLDGGADVEAGGAIGRDGEVGRDESGVLGGAPSEVPALLEVRELCIGTRDRTGRYLPIVDGVSFRLGRGEALGIVGESGCGKTMTALAVIGLLPKGVVVSGGYVNLRGVNLVGAKETEKQRLRGSVISMIGQEPVAGLDPSFTVGSQLVEVLRRHSALSRAEAKREAYELLERVGLPDAKRIAGKYAHELSGGMAQRVGIATALAGKPELLIADEPTTALDVTVQAEILELLRSLRETSDLALVLVSHDWGVIADSCESAVVMYAGQVVEAAGIGTLFRSPRHPYTYGLMTANPHYASAPGSKLGAIPGAVPVLGAWPAGCHFAPRCSLASEECRAAPVAIREVGAAHEARCIHSAAVGVVSAQERVGNG